MAFCFVNKKYVYLLPKRFFHFDQITRGTSISTTLKLKIPQVLAIVQKIKVRKYFQSSNLGFGIWS
jgi:hypothetical protein